MTSSRLTTAGVGTTLSLLTVLLCVVGALGEQLGFSYFVRGLLMGALIVAVLAVATLLGVLVRRDAAERDRTRLESIDPLGDLPREDTDR
ncbi:hypothetical protein GCM10022286_01970 [Gryllotalpicola daejeonensis]|uniref:Uncharacterized protein n=1 Tax=Gryllotalpicola daejeonensis TaxID=993087 RepID=A0ABP7ZDV9_9MICO